jgi:hypothetical protein
LGTADDAVDGAAAHAMMAVAAKAAASHRGARALKRCDMG